MMNGKDDMQADAAQDNVAADIMIPRLPPMAMAIDRGAEVIVGGSSLPGGSRIDSTDMPPFPTLPTNCDLPHNFRRSGWTAGSDIHATMRYKDHVICTDTECANSVHCSSGSSSAKTKHAQDKSPAHKDWIVESLMGLKKTPHNGDCNMSYQEVKEGENNDVKASGHIPEAMPNTKQKKKKQTGNNALNGSGSSKKPAHTYGSIEANRNTNAARQSAINDSTWNQRLAQLRQFKEQHGHTNVPQKWEHNPSLGAWVARNRLFMRQWEGDPSSCSGNQSDRVKILKEVGLSSVIGECCLLPITKSA